MYYLKGVSVPQAARTGSVGAEGRTQCVLKAVNAQIAKTAQTPIVPHKQRKVRTC